MKTKKAKLITILLLLLVALGIILSGCSSSKSVWGSKKDGLNMMYRLNKDQLQYASEQNIKESMEIRGGNYDVLIAQTLQFTMNDFQTEGSNKKFNITVDSMNFNIKSPERELDGDVSNVIGKSFQMGLTNQGKEMDIEGAEKLKYKLDESTERSIKTVFLGFFPDLSKDPVKKGDSWITSDTIEINEDQTDLTLIFNSKHTLMDYVKVDDIECALITAKVTGSMESATIQENQEITTSGTIDGEHTWYFAYKQGYLVKEMLNATVNGVIEVSQQGIEIPLSRTMDIKTNLINR